jgi:hypothetical protein
VLSFYLDEDCQSDAYVSALRAAGLAVTTVNDQGNNGFTDRAQLEVAAERGWVLVTRNTRDFAAIHTAWWREGRRHAGIVCITRASLGPGALAAALARLSHERPEGIDAEIHYVSAAGTHA